MIYILILAISLGGGSAVTTQEFNSKTACEGAIKAVEEGAAWINRVNAYCVEKGKP